MPHFGILTNAYICEGLTFDGLKEASNPIKVETQMTDRSPQPSPVSSYFNPFAWLTYYASRETSTKHQTPQHQEINNKAALDKWYKKAISVAKARLAQYAQNINEVIDSSDETITVAALMEKSKFELEALTSNLCQMEALTAASGEIDKFIARHHQPIITFISWGVIGKITNWLSQIKPFRYLINDKFLLFKDATNFKKDIEDVKRELRALNEQNSPTAKDEARIKMDRLIIKASNVQANADKISQHSCYVFWRRHNRKAAREQKELANACQQTFSGLMRAF
jgi:hypothetical protein